MECNKSLADLLGELHSNIDMLQKAITEVGHVKASLKTTASDLKSQIRDSVSRHLEALRNRETWLLGQVEVVQQVKEEVLRQQQAELNKALGRLQSTCVLLEQSGEVFDTESLECHVRESLKVVGSLNLTPDETKIINFVAQNFELQEFIQKFGVVVSDNPVVDRQMVSQMLGFAKKTTFFTPSGPCEEWLMKSNGTGTSQDILNIPSVKLNIQDWLQQKPVPGVSTVESSISSPEQHPIEQWLFKGQSQNSSAETRNGLEPPEKKASENEAWLLDSSKLSSSSEMPSDNLFSYYRVVKMSESSQWLKKSGITEHELSTNLIGKTYRDIASSPADKWLKKKVQSTGSTKLSRSMSTQSCSECSCGLTSECPESGVQEMSAEFDDTLSEMSDWLAVRKEDVETGTDIIAFSSHIPDEVPNNDRWLLKQSCEANIRVQDYTGIKRYKENLAAQSNQQWLHPCSENATDNREVKELTSSGMKSYIESLPVGYNHWLSSPSTDKDICKWLARSSSESCKNCPVMCSKGVFKVFDQIASSKDGWLLSQELY
ncbi:hypothetical protein ACROYT_G030505 [Oculina patagonica]